MGVRSPGTGVKDWCELSCACWELNLCLLTAKPSLQLPKYLVFIEKKTGGKGKPCDLFKVGNYLIAEPGLEPRVPTAQSGALCTKTHCLLSWLSVKTLKLALSPLSGHRWGRLKPSDSAHPSS